ncbi:MAG: glycosyltransferase family 2 protein [Treponema sp.]|uniref:glycosyltransferase family 2 protein n=1 Tax=Treponema sp. TaxID=166 RepID=UPI00298E2777|nr:glycosyltransferase family 2 protein [Treponema sp.]MBR5933593.1 glycosyltransferase family 2 protein [Treponema sp.]
MPTKVPKYSLIIPTIGRDVQVDDLLTSIEKSGIKDFETILVDQNDDDRLVSVVKKHKVLKIKHLRADFKSATQARNFGFEKSKGEYIIFPDDDSEFLPDTVLKVESLFKEFNPDVLTGRAIDRNEGDAVCNFKKTSAWLDMSNYDGRYVEFTEVYKREIFEKYPFDTEIGVGRFYGSGEAQDQMIRMLRDGVKVYYSADLKFFHPVKVNMHESKSEIKRSFFYSCGYSYVCRKNKVKDADIRLKKLLLYIPYCMIFKRKYLRYYLAELAGLIAGKYIDLK